MGVFRRRPGTDLPLARGERALVVVPVTGGTEVVATTERLVVRRPGEPDWERRWVEVDHATWDAQERALTVVDVVGGGTTLDLVDDGQLGLAQVVRERVQSTIVTFQTVIVPGGEVKVAVRKDGDRLVVQETASAGADLSGPGAAALVASTRRDLASSVGLVDPPPA